MLDLKLAREYADYYLKRHLLRGVQSFASTVKLQFSDTDRQSYFIQVSDGDDFNNGCIEFSW